MTLDMATIRGVRQARAGDFDFTALGEISLHTLAIRRDAHARGKQTVSAIIDSPGGQAATAALACGRLGWRSRWIGAIGDDVAGERSVTTLQVQHIETTAIVRPGVPSRRAVILIDAASGDREVLQHRDAHLNIAPGEVPEDQFTSTRVLLVDASDPVHAIHAARAARRADVRTIVDIDVVWEGIDELLAWIDLVVMPGDIVEIASGVHGLGQGLAELCRRSGAQAAIATLGSEGVLAWTGGRELRVPAAPTNVVDTTGAGDAFRAGLAASWLARAGSDADLAAMLGDGNTIGALACRAAGAQTALPARLEAPSHLRGPL